MKRMDRTGSYNMETAGIGDIAKYYKEGDKGSKK